MVGAQFCTRCGKRQRSLNHVCQPSAVKKMQAIREFRKAHQVQKPR